MSEPLLTGLNLHPNVGPSRKYIWCDYIELRCLTHPDKRFARDNLAETVEEFSEMLVDMPEENNFDMAPDEDFPLSGALEPTQKDKNEAKYSDYFQQLRTRASMFGRAWPFLIDDHGWEIRLIATYEELTDTQLLYLQLLLSSLLRYCGEGRRHELTSAFEHLSLRVFTSLLPPHSEVHAFGAAQSHRYRGHLYDRLRSLAKDVRGRLLLEREDFPAQDVGDGGLDIVAWHPMFDTREGIPISFAQCGCSVKDWPEKMLQASPARLAGHFVTMAPWSTYYFMPLDLMDLRTDREVWMRRADFSQAIVIDRLRLIRLADENELTADLVEIKDQIAEAISGRYSE